MFSDSHLQITFIRRPWNRPGTAGRLPGQHPGGVAHGHLRRPAGGAVPLDDRRSHRSGCWRRHADDRQSGADSKSSVENTEVSGALLF